MTGQPGSESAYHQLEIRLGYFLRLGVMLSAAVVLLGGILYLIRHGAEHPAYGKFLGEPDRLRTLGGIISGTAELRGKAIIQLGLLLLIATPITRVALAGVGFLKQRDWKYVAIAGFVLCLLLYGLLSGR